MTFPHYMRPVHRSVWPRVVWLLAHDQSRHESMMLELMMGSDGYQTTCDATPPKKYTPLSFFPNLSQNVAAITIISPHAVDLWSQYRLWEGLEQGYIQLSGSDHRAPGGHESEHRRRQSGLMVTQDVPSILSFVLPPAKTVYTWLDIGNWGVKLDWSRLAADEQLVVMEEWFTSFHAAAITYHLGGLCHTAGSQSLHAFRRHYYTGGIHHHDSVTARQIERGCFRGGRAEAHRLGVATSSLYYVDIAGAYPYCCWTGRVPVRCRHAVSDCGGLSLPSPNPARTVLARVTLTTEEPAYPWCADVAAPGDGDTLHRRPPSLIPGRTMDTLFPVGTFTTCLAGPELTDALEHNRVRAVHEWADYDLEPALRDFAQSMREWRVDCARNDNHELAMTAKLVANSIVGKFGQSSKTWDNCPHIIAPCEYGVWEGVGPDKQPCRYRAIAGVTQREVQGDFGFSAVPAIAAYITAMCRMRLLEVARLIGWERVYYVDTDAVMVDGDGLELMVRAGLIQPGEWGQWDIRWGPSTVDIRGLKYYVHDGQLTCAGLPPGICTDVGDGVHYDMRLSVHEQIRRGQRPQVKTVRCTYRRTTDYAGGRVLPNGLVEPWRIVDGKKT